MTYIAKYCNNMISSRTVVIFMVMEMREKYPQITLTELQSSATEIHTLTTTCKCGGDRTHDIWSNMLRVLNLMSVGQFITRFSKSDWFFAEIEMYIKHTQFLLLSKCTVLF